MMGRLMPPAGALHATRHYTPQFGFFRIITYDCGITRYRALSTF